jgi:glycosyltransferase involved in cell wall biosynthesis
VRYASSIPSANISYYHGMDKASQTLVILIPGFPKDERDSTCLPFAQSFVRVLKNQNPGLNIIVLAFQYPFSKSRYLWHGVQVFAFSGRNKGKLQRLWLWKSVWKQLAIIMKQREVIGILNFWLGECALLGHLASRKWRVKCFTWILGQDAKKGNRYRYLVNPAPASLIALSDFISDELHKNYRLRPTHTIPPGIDHILIGAPVSGRNIDIMGAGSLIPLKQFDKFIELVDTLVTFKPDLRVLICGEGPEREKLEFMIRDRNLGSHIKLTGRLEHETVLQLMQSARLFLHTSSYEGYGMVCAEALNAGAHVISYRKPVKTVFKHWHIARTDAEMQQTMAALLNDSGLEHEAEQIDPIEETCRSILNLYN